MKNILITTILGISLLYACKAQKENSVNQDSKAMEENQNVSEVSALEGFAGNYTVEFIDNLASLKDVEATIVIDASGRISGKNGCNSYFGEIKLEGGEKLIDKLGSTRMLCRNAANETEKRMMELLGMVDNIEIQDDKLLLFVDGNEVIKAQKSTLNGEWKVLSIGKNQIDENGIVFTISGFALNGNTGCNAFSGQVDFQENSFELGISEMSYTEMVCEEIDPTQETKFLNSWDKVTSYKLLNNVVTFFYNKEVLFTAKRNGE